MRIEAVNGTGAWPIFWGAAVLLGGGLLGYVFLVEEPGFSGVDVIPLVPLAVGALLLWFGVRKMRIARQYQADRAAVLANGLRIEAVVIGLTQITSTRDAMPNVQLMLRYETPDGKSHNAFARYTVPDLMVDSVREGTRLNIIAALDDPFSPHTIIDWDHRP